MDEMVGSIGRMPPLLSPITVSAAWHPMTSKHIPAPSLYTMGGAGSGGYSIP